MGALVASVEHDMGSPDTLHSFGPSDALPPLDLSLFFLEKGKFNDNGSWLCIKAVGRRASGFSHPMHPFHHNRIEFESVGQKVQYLLLSLVPIMVLHLWAFSI